MKVRLSSLVRIGSLTLLVSAVPCLPTDAQLSLTDGAEDLASQITTAVKKEQKQKIAVLPFRELTGRSNYFGAYLAEDLITRLFQVGDFDIVERSMLDRLLEEMKLGESGVIDPETAKQVGKIAGVDAVVTGTMTDLPSSIAVNCRLIDVESGRVFAAAQVRIFKDPDVITTWKTPVPSMQATEIGNGSEIGNSEEGGGGSRSSGTVETSDKKNRNQPFVTADYTLSIKSLRIRGGTAELDLVVRSERDEVIYFGISQPYLVDSEGHRLELQDVDSARFVRGGVELLPHSTLQSRLVFGREGSTRVGGWVTRGGREESSFSIKGDVFTFAADELSGGRRYGQKIIMKIHATD